MDDKLSVKIVADVSDLKKGLDQGEKSLKKFGAEGKKASDNLSNLKGTSTGALGAIKKFRADIGAAQYAVAAFAAGFALLTKAQLDNAKEVKILSDRVGVASDKFSQLAVISKRLGAETEDVYDVFKDFGVRVTDAANGATGYEDALRKIGLQSRDLIGLRPEDQIYKLSDALKGATEEAQRFSLDALLSDPGLKMIQVLNKGSDALKEMMNAAAETGAALSKADLERFDELNVTFIKFSESVGTLAKKVASELSPQFTKLIDKITGATDALGKFFGDAAPEVAPMVAQMTTRQRAITEEVRRIIGRMSAMQDSLAMKGVSADEIANNSVMQGYKDALIDLGQKMASITRENDKMVASIAQQKEISLLVTVDGATLGPQLPSTEDDAMMIMEQMRTDFLSEQLEERVRLNVEAINSMGKDQYDFNAALIEQERNQQQATRMIWESGWKGKADIMGDMLQDMSSLMNSESRKMFEVGKAAATASAIIETISSAQKAFSAMAGIPYIGPALGAAAAIAAIAAGMARVQQIQSTSFGSKSGGGGSGGGVAGTPQPQEVINTTNVDISLQGDRFGGDSVRSMLGAINSAIADGGKIGAINVR